MNDNGKGEAVAQPRARSLDELVDALETVESELGFQVMRLNEHVNPRTEEEAKYHEDLKHGYQSSQYYVRLLKRYHQGRLDRQRGGEALADDPTNAGIDASGHAAAFFED